MDPDAALIRLAVLGQPVKHSHSPWIHARFAEQAGLEVEYRAIEVDAGHLSRVVQSLADEPARGCNITLPHKEAAFDLANSAGDRARISGSANTLVFASPSRWRAENTDGIGLVRDLTANLALSLKGRSVCVVGAGGAAAGILYDLLAQKPASLTVLNRSPERAEALAARFADVGEVLVGDLQSGGTQEGYDLVIHATAAGHRGTEPVLEPRLFAADGICYDLNYGRAHDALAQWSGGQGIACFDGLGMLVEQAAESFRIWTGFMPDTGPVIAALRERAG